MSRVVSSAMVVDVEPGDEFVRLTFMLKDEIIFDGKLTPRFAKQIGDRLYNCAVDVDKEMRKQARQRAH